MRNIPWTFLICLILGTHCQNEDCEKNSDCTTKGSICQKGKCECDSISSYYEASKQCLPYATEYKAYCQESGQCEEWLGANSECEKNQCVCKKQYRWFRGSCQPFVNKGESCNTDSECYNGYDMLSLKCSEGKCVCNEGYYDRGEDCRQESPSTGDCAIDIDCSRTGNVRCGVGHCIKNTEKIENTVENLPLNIADEDFVHYADDTTCKFDDDCRNTANSVCDVSMGRCRCKTNSYLLEGNCLPGFGPCDTCSIKNSMCFKNTCICKQGYFARGETCVPELGMVDSFFKDGNCTIKPGRVVNSACYCKTYWFNDDSNRNCIKTTLQQTHACLTSDWCNAMGPNSICSSTTNQCQCSSFAKLDESNFYCSKYKDPPIGNGSCLRESDCPLNEICVDEKCECVKSFSRHDEDDTCLPDLGGTCEITGCSHIENSRCAGGFCTCVANYTGTKDRCLKVADKLDDPCEDSIQCENFQNSECGPSTATKKTCVCQNKYMDVGNKCMQMKEYGDPCMKETDCTLVLNHSFKCRKNKCMCQTKYVLKDGYCTPSAATYVKATSILIVFIVILTSA